MDAPRAVRRGSHHVAFAVARHPPSAHAAQDRRAARLGGRARLQHHDAGAFREDEAGAVGGVGPRGALGVLVVVRVVGAHRIESGVEVRIALLAAAGDGRLGVPRLDQHRRQQDVVGAAGAGGAGRERRPRRLQHVHQIGRGGRGHHPRDHRREHAPAVAAGLQLLLDVDVRADVAGTRAHHHGEIAPLQPRLREGAPRGTERQPRLTAEEAALRLADAEVGIGERAWILPRDLTAAVDRHAGRVERERRVAPLPQHGFDGGEIVAEVTEHAGAGDDHVPVAAARTPIPHLVCAAPPG